MDETIWSKPFKSKIPAAPTLSAVVEGSAPAIPAFKVPAWTVVAPP